MPTTYNNKIVLTSGEVLIDLTGDTVTADKLLAPFTAHDKSGAPIEGSCTFNADTRDTSASADEVLSGETFYGPTGQKVTGTMPNRGGVTGTISIKAGQYTVPQGYHDGSGKVGISQTEQNKIIAGNIKAGVQILGVTGTYSGESIQAQVKSATPSFEAQTILPDANYDYLSQVNLAAIPVTYTPNASGGNTVTIG